MKQLALTLVFGFAFAWTVCGQVSPPTFLCVSNDTLFWETPSNTCGPFNAYLVFASQNAGGPYSQLAAITDPNQDFFVHQNAGMGTWFYYLESDFNCPGQTALPSDTLDNLIPERARLESVSVSGSDVEVSWVPSPSPEVVAYIISRTVPGQGNVVLDTVFNDTFYLDQAATPTEQSEIYFIEAIDACGNKSLIAEPHSTILLATEGSDPCERSISLSWNLYQNWPQGIGSHEVWVSRNGSAPERVATLDGNASTYRFQNADDAVEYCFTVRAFERSSGVMAASSEACISLDVVQAVKGLAATNATVTDNGEVQLEWVWNANAEINDYAILRSTDNSNFTVIESGTPPTPLSVNNTYLDSGANPSGGVAYYQVQTTDGCNEKASSNIVGTLFLRATAQSGTNIIRWTPYLNPLGTAQGYSLYRIEGGGAVLLGDYGPNTLEAADNNIDLSNPEQVRSCYFVEALAEVALNDSTRVVVNSRSNTACAEQEARIYIPNAFSPNEDGRNDEFRPFLQFGTPADYTLSIYDRYGGKLFETTDVDKGWDGKSRGKRVPVGLYVYHVRVEQANGTVIEQSGEVSLLR
ncbi:MAG: gliding motility-associated C-terminal domain-containing protein [Lewinellaceae bacterium]|nr:gliding motility-associated C-terminal domain-containing protein [Lewinellaceae bacterium]